MPETTTPAFSMELFNVTQIAEEVQETVKVEDEKTKELRTQAENNALAIFNGDISSIQTKSGFIKSIEEFGLNTMQKSAEKNNLLKTQVSKLSQSGADGGEISNSLTALNREIKDLDPSALDFAKKGLFGKLTNPIRGYFDKYEKSENVIANIIESLDRGKKTLNDDNTTLMIEQQSLRNLTLDINNQIALGTMMDEALSAQIAQKKAENSDPDKIKFVEDEILFPLRQRLIDMQTLLAVNQQGVVSMEIVQRNNRELIRAVDRAKTVTVTALRTAVMVASALYNQKIVLQKIQVLQETTNNVILATSRMLKEQGAEIHKQAINPAVSVDALKQAWNDVTTSLEEISMFKQQALPQMAENIKTFKQLANDGEKAILRFESGNKVALDLNASSN